MKAPTENVSSQCSCPPLIVSLPHVAKARKNKANCSRVYSAPRNKPLLPNPGNDSWMRELDSNIGLWRQLDMNFGRAGQGHWVDSTGQSWNGTQNVFISTFSMPD